MRNTIKCKLYHTNFGTIEVNGLYAFCKQYNQTPFRIRKLIEGLKDEVNGWVVAGNEAYIKPKPQPKPDSTKDYVYKAGVVTPHDTKIKPFQTIFTGEDEQGLTSYHDHIPVFAADKSSLYKRFVALFTLNFSSYKGLQYRTNLQDDTKVIDFWEEFLEDLNRHFSPRQLFKYHTTFYNLPLNLKHSLYETALVLYRLEHEEDEE
ncbi:hypothetical protein [Vibrio cholerae]|uniref:hypothetical protein n=1 Tax=Vibrio cholerae TaxID=666 RepID=UPI0011D58ED9|nr:hypothetical protein [Vibrio cholerae]TXX48341.1 hypothetical protein FXF14_11015 [Vibrio cholerae]